MASSTSTPLVRPLLAPTLLERGCLAAAGITIAALVLATALAARSWIARPFPGFLVLPNGVVASVGLPDWPGTTRDVYQRHVDAVGGVPTTDSGSIYAHAAARRAGTAVEYTLHGRHGSETVAITTTLFGARDYWAVFGGYLFSGGLYLAAALLAVWCRPADAIGTALALLGGVAGVYALSSVGLYQPDGALRTHALAEAAFPAALVQLAAAVAGPERPAWRCGALLAAILAPSLAIPYAFLAYSPSAYSALHAASEAAIGIAGLVLLTTLLHAWLARAQRDPLLSALTVGATLGIGCPAVVLGVSGLSGGKLPVNVMAATAFLFPLAACLGLLVERSTSGSRALAREIA